MVDDYDIQIEIDADTNEVIWTTGTGKQYFYTVEELEGKGDIQNAIHGGAQITVYSQGERYTKEEYEELFKEEL